MTTAEQTYRQQFSEDPGYLDFARVGPPSRAVVEASHAGWSALAGAGTGTADDLADAEERAMTVAGRLLGRPREHVAPTPSTSAGLLQVAFALRAAGRRPRVLVSPAEFPANLLAWRRAEQLGHLEVGTLPAAPVTPERVRTALDDAERAGAPVDAVALSAVDFVTGYRADLAGLRDVVADRLLVLDAIQALGVVDEDWRAADVVVAGGQKWLRCGWGTGVLAVCDRALERLEPRLAGWSAVEDPARYDGEEQPLAADAERFTTTKASPVAQGMLAAGLDLLETAGPAWVGQQVSVRVEELLAVLDAQGAEVVSERRAPRRAGIVALAVPGTRGADLHAALLRGGVQCTLQRTTATPGVGERVRLSAHATTTREAVERVDAVLAALG